MKTAAGPDTKELRKPQASSPPPRRQVLRPTGSALPQSLARQGAAGTEAEAGAVQRGPAAQGSAAHRPGDSHLTSSPASHLQAGPWWGLSEQHQAQHPEACEHLIPDPGSCPRCVALGKLWKLRRLVDGRGRLVSSGKVDVPTAPDTSLRRTGLNEETPARWPGQGSGKTEATVSSWREGHRPPLLPVPLSPLSDGVGLLPAHREPWPAAPSQPDPSSRLLPGSLGDPSVHCPQANAAPAPTALGPTAVPPRCLAHPGPPQQYPAPPRVGPAVPPPRPPMCPCQLRPGPCGPPVSISGMNEQVQEWTAG